MQATTIEERLADSVSAHRGEMNAMLSKPLLFPPSAAGHSSQKERTSAGGAVSQEVPRWAIPVSDLVAVTTRPVLGAGG